MFVAGGLLWKSIQFRAAGLKGEPLCWQLYGWPWTFYTIEYDYSHVSIMDYEHCKRLGATIEYGALFLDVDFAIGLLLAIAFACESVIRLRKA